MNVELQERFRRKLREALAIRGWSQSEFARRLKMTPATVGDYLLGRTCPGLNIIEKFEIALELKRGNLVDDQPLQILEPAA
jgi:ribosome-binding protein aMBF1 (putative translation factor)